MAATSPEARLSLLVAQDACSRVAGAAGAVVLATRGGCVFTTKAQAAATSGAAALIVANDGDDGYFVMQPGAGVDTSSGYSIPVVGVPASTGRWVEAVTPDLRTSHQDCSFRAGAYDGGMNSCLVCVAAACSCRPSSLSPPPSPAGGYGWLHSRASRPSSPSPPTPRRKTHSTTSPPTRPSDPPRTGASSPTSSPRGTPSRR